MRRSTGTPKAKGWIYNNIKTGVYESYRLDVKGNLIRRKASKTPGRQLTQPLSPGHHPMPMPAFIPMFDNIDIDSAPIPSSDGLADSAETSGFGMDTLLDEHDESGDDWDSFMTSPSNQGSKE
jgi:hypothetical protein